MSVTHRYPHKILLTSLMLALIGLCFGFGFVAHTTQADTPHLAIYDWGANTNGELGSGNTTPSATPLMATLPNGANPVTVVTGNGHSLAIGSDGKIYAWGRNTNGELGNGSTISRSVPVTVSLPAGVTATSIAASGFHNMALGSDGKIYAWGDNSYGAFGNGTTVSSSTPVSVTFPAGVSVASMALGYDHSLAIGSDGNLYAWGRNTNGELGNGNTTNSSTPVTVTLPAGVTATSIAAGNGHSLAIGSDGNLYAWGRNTNGELGNGNTTDMSTPVAINLPNGATPTSIAGGESHTLSTGNNGQLYAWGYNAYGQLGNGTTITSTTPVTVTLPVGVTASIIAGGFNHSMALGSDGKLYAWGNNQYGQFGNGTFTNSLTPVLTTLPNGVSPTSLSSTANHILALFPIPLSLSISNAAQQEGNSGTTNLAFTVSLNYSSTQTVTVNYATSDGTATAPSDYTTTNSTLTFSPGITTQMVNVPVNGDTAVEASETFTVTLSNPISASLAISQGTGIIINDDQTPVAGLVYDWGLNFQKHLGNNLVTSPYITGPVIVNPPNGLSATTLADGLHHSLAIGTDNKLYAWGDNTKGQLGISSAITNSATPVLVNLPAGVTPTTIAAEASTSLAIGSDGKLYAWGDNQYGQLGNGSTVTSTATPVVVSFPAGVTPTALAAGLLHNLAIGSDGKLYAWGYNAYGQLGNGTTTNSTTPIVVNLPTGVTPVDVTTGDHHSLVLGSNGKLYAWGYNNVGQLGNGTTSNSSTPVAVNLPTGIVATKVIAGGYFNFAYGSDGKLYAWGDNIYGQLGNGTTTIIGIQTPITANLFAGGPPIALALGDQYSLAIAPDGKLYSWGYNADGELGNGTVNNRTTPGLVTLPAGVTPNAIEAGIFHSMALLPATPSVSINNVSQAEGNSGTTNFNFTISLSFTTTQTVTVSYATSNGTAIAPGDYIASTGTVTFAPNTISQTLSIPVVGDTAFENNETFTVTLSSPAYAFLGISQGTGTIISDDIFTTSLMYDWGRGDSGQLGNGTTPANSNMPVMANLPSGVSPTAIAAGAFYGMASGNDGKLYAWGSNQYGQLGNGSTTNSATPMVVTLPAGVTPTAIATGDNHSLAIGNDGKLYAWGLNSSGQLGNGSTTNSATPVTVTLPAGVTPTAIDAGDNHSLATGSDGKLYAWGSNSFGQLGNGTTSNSVTPGVVNLPAGVTPTIIAAGGEYSFAVGNNGKLYAWGRNSTGQLGNGTANNNPTTTPFVVTLPAGVIPTAIDAGGNHTIAIANDGKLYTWGANTYGQLGNGNSIQSNIPITATLPAGVTPVAIAAGGEFTFMLGSDGKLYDCGRNDVGQLGNATYTSQSTLGMVNFPAGLTPRVIAGGDYLSMAILSLPSLSINNVSQAEGNSGTTNFTFTVTLAYASSQTVTVNYATGDGTATAPSDYTTITGTLTFSPGITTQAIMVLGKGDTQLEPDETFTVTLANPNNATIATAQGTGTIINDDLMPPSVVSDWGRNNSGQLGNGTYTNANTPIYANLPAGVYATAVSAGAEYSLATGTDGKLYAWGVNNYGQLGNGSTITNSNMPVVVSLPAGVTPTKIFAGMFQALAIGNDGKLYAWGLNSKGQLGNGTITNSNVPVVVQLPAGVTPIAIQSGDNHVLSLGNNGKLYAWGANDFGELGNGTIISSTVPVTVNLPAGVTPTTIAAGGEFSLAIGDNGKLYAWGRNFNGQLGTGVFTANPTTTPITATLPTGVIPVAIEAGGNHTLMIGNNNQLYAWGANGSGEIGNGTLTNSALPVSITLANGVTPVAITDGSELSLAVGSDGKLYSWGLNTYGQLGNGSNTNRLSPGLVTLPAGATPLAISAGDTHTLALLPTLPNLSINNVSQAEGNSGTTNFTFTVTLSYASSQTVTVNYATGDGTATTPSDYTATTGTLTFSPGITTQSVMVPVVGDTVIEPNETFTVTLSNAINATISATQGTGTILNDDVPPALSINNVSQAEGNSGTTPFTFTVSLGYSSSQTITVNYTTSDGTATASSDYQTASGTLTFSPGIITQTVTVLVNGDTQLESDETFTVTLASANNATIATAQGIGTIVNDDTLPPTLSINNVSQTEGNSGTTPFTFTVSLNYAPSQTVTVNYVTSDGTATAPSDYTAISGTLTFSPGITTQTVTVLVNGDTLVEPNETFTVTLSNPVNATIATAQGIGTIISDDYTRAGLVYDWGRGDSGQLGNGSTPANTNVPVMASLPSGVSPTAIAAGAFYGMASGNDGKLYAWGNNQYGQLGNGSTTNSATPVVVTLPAGVTPTAIATGDNHSLAIGSNGKLYAWGLNSSGQLGNGSTTNSATPVTVILPAGVTPTAIDAGDNHSLALGSDGKLYAWGSNSFGQLGNGITSNSATPVVVNLPAGVTPTIIAAGGEYSFAVGNNGKLYAWGRNSTGQLGNGTANNNPTTTPFVVTLPAGVIPTAIDAGGNHTIAIANDGKLYTWGANDYGQLGNGNNTQSNIPITATLPAGVTPVAIAAGGEFTLMLGSDGKLYDCGRNDVGQLGNGSYTSRSTLGMVNFPAGLTPGVIAAGDYLGMAILSLPNLSINNVSQAEGNTGTTNFTFTVTLAYAPSQTVTVNYATGNGTATAPSDYTAITGTLTFSPGITTQTVTVPVVGDTVIEPNETFTVTLSNATNAAILTAQGTGTIINDDAIINTTITLTSSPNPSTVGQIVTFTATVSPTAASGTVTFTEGTTVLGTANVVSGSAVFTTSTLLVGSHVISATYGGDATYAPSTSNTVTQVVNLVPTNLNLTSNPNPSTVGQIVTFTATISPTAASGTVTFTEGAIVLGTASVVSGTAVFTTSTLIVGSHVISATYGGDAIYAPSTSNTVTQVVGAGCAPLLVTAITDNGTGTTCGTLSYALSQPITGSTPVTITFALTQGNTITFTGSLTTTAKVKAGVTIYGGAFGSASRIILNGNGVAGDGLDLLGHNYLVNLTIEHFGGKELVLEGTGNRLQGVVVIAS